MKYTMGISNKTLKKTLGEVINTYDKDKNGFKKNELKDMISGSVSIFAKPFITDKTISQVQTTLDENKDGTITETELNKYLNKNYQLKLEDAKSMKIQDLANLIEKKDKQKKSAKK